MVVVVVVAVVLVVMAVTRMVGAGRPAGWLANQEIGGALSSQCRVARWMTMFLYKQVIYHLHDAFKEYIALYIYSIGLST